MNFMKRLAVTIVIVMILCLSILPINALSENNSISVANDIITLLIIITIVAIVIFTVFIIIVNRKKKQDK